MICSSRPSTRAATDAFRQLLAGRDRSSALRASPLLGRVGRSRRREVGEQVGRVHLEEIHRLRQAAKPPGAKASEADPLCE
jgi:hypothetical protein